LVSKIGTTKFELSKFPKLFNRITDRPVSSINSRARIQSILDSLDESIQKESLFPSGLIDENVDIVNDDYFFSPGRARLPMSAFQSIQPHHSQ